MVTPTTGEAESLYYKLASIDGVQLINEESGELPEGVILLSAGQSKGLEFDQVISIRKKPVSYLEKNAEYITCTRALHELFILEI